MLIAGLLPAAIGASIIQVVFEQPQLELKSISAVDPTLRLLSGAYRHC